MGQRPNCSTGDHFAKRAQQRRRQRSVPASNFAHPQMRPPSCSIYHSHIVAPDGRDRVAGLSVIAAFSRKQGISSLRRRVGGNENRRSLRSPPTPLRGAHAHAWLLSWQGETTLAGVNPAIIALLWGSPHADGCKKHPNCDQKMKNPRKMVIMLARE